MTCQSATDSRGILRYEAIVVGGSAGGTEALCIILRTLPVDYFLPLLVVEHVHVTDDGGLAGRLREAAAMRVVVARDKEPVSPGTVYVAPANYHMLVERGGTIALSVDERVKWSRPSIDVLFESAALAWGPRLAAVLLSGANDDGVAGLLKIRERGGLTIAQDPQSARFPLMPQSAITAGVATEILDPPKIGARLNSLQPQLLVEARRRVTPDEANETTSNTGPRESNGLE